MKHFNRLKQVIIITLLVMTGTWANAQQALYFSEIMFDKDDGSNGEYTYEYIEIVGEPELTIAANTYIGIIEGDGDSGSQGDIKWWFDISNITLGSNGYLVIRHKGSPYIVNPDATVVTGASAGTTTNESSDGFNDLDAGAYEGSGSKGEIESPSQTFLLINSTSSVSRNDIYDGDQDGTPNEAGDESADWTILDKIAVLDDDDGTGGAKELGYGSLVYRYEDPDDDSSDGDIKDDATENNSNYILESGATEVELSFKAGYIARVGRTTGYTTSDWMAGQTQEEGIYLKIKSQSPGYESWDNLVLSTIGGPNFEVTYTTANGFTLDGSITQNPMSSLNLIMSDDYASTADISCFDLTIEALKTLTIASGHTLTVNGDLTVEGSLIVESGASLITSDGGTVTGNVTIHRNTNGSALGYSFVGSPVEADSEITGSDIGSPVYSYNEALAYSETGGARWENASATALVPGVGYAQAGQGSISFTGVPNDGTITVTGLTYSAGTDNEQGWNLLSNPYPAAIDATAFMAANTSLNGSIYLWNDPNDGSQGDNNDYVTVSNLGSVNGNFNGYIGAMQGFFVKVTSVGTIDATFTEGMRDAGSNDDANFFRKAEENPLNIKLAIQSDNGLYNETLIGLRSDATLGIDRIYDASKLIGNSNIAFYSLIGDGKYAIQGLPVKEGVSTELAFNLGEASDLKLSVVELSGLESGMTFFLEDKVNGEVYDLNEINGFDFAAVAGSDQNRFTLTYRAAKVLSNSITSNQPIYRYANSQLMVNFGKSLEIRDYAVYDLSGKILLEGSSLSSINELSIPISNKGVNIIKIVTSEGVFTRKFLF